MFDFESILQCPACGESITKELICRGCGATYSKKHGVYNLISLSLSGGQDFLWKGDIPTDEHINSLINSALGVIENGTY